MTSPTRIHVLLAVLATSLLVAPAPSRASGLPNRTLSAINNSFSLSFMESQVGYGERATSTGSGPSFPYMDTDQGGLHGARIAVSGMRDDGIDNLYARASFSEVSGQLQFNGASGTGPQSSKMTDWALRVGQGFVWGRYMLFTPYVTYGHHNWLRGGIQKFSNEYLGGGVLFQAAVASHLAMTLNFAYAETLRPALNSPSVTEGLGTSPWKRAGVSFDYRFARND